MRKFPVTIIAPRELEKLRAVCRTEIAVPIVSTACLWEINQKSKLREFWPKTSTHSLARDAVALPVFPTNRRLCSSLEVAAFEQAPAASSLFDCGISAPVARRRLASVKPSGRLIFYSLPHENEMLRKRLRSSWRTPKNVSGMSRKENNAAMPTKLIVLDERLNSVNARESLFFNAAFPHRQEGVHFHLESLCQNDQLGICHAAKLRFNLRERGTAQIPSLNRTASGEHFLRQSLLIAQLSDLRANDVLRFGHAPKTELDTKTGEELNCTNFGAI